MQLFIVSGHGILSRQFGQCEPQFEPFRSAGLDVVPTHVLCLFGAGMGYVLSQAGLGVAIVYPRQSP